MNTLGVAPHDPYKTQRNTALEILAENHWIRMDKKDNQAMIEVNPQAITAWD